MRKTTISLLFLLSGCATMTDTQKTVAWSIVGGIAITSVVMSLDDSPTPRDTFCQHSLYRTDIGSWVCLDPGYYSGR